MLATLRRQWERAAPARSLPARRRQQPVARPALAADRHRRLPRNAGRALGAATRAHAEDRRLVEVALRNTRNAARLVQSLGDLAKLDEPEFRLHASRGRRRRAARRHRHALCRAAPQRSADRGARAAADGGGAPPFAALDIELFERAIANLIDNALKFCPRGAHISCAAAVDGQRRSTSASPTTDRASRRPTCRTCSTASTRAARASRRRPARAARVSAWRSSSASSSCTAARSRSTARRDAARGSR